MQRPQVSRFESALGTELILGKEAEEPEEGAKGSSGPSHPVGLTALGAQTSSLLASSPPPMPDLCSFRAATTLPGAGKPERELEKRLLPECGITDIGS